MTPVRVALVLALALACGHALVPSESAGSDLQRLLTSAVERSVTRIGAADACAGESPARIDVVTRLGPLARALHGTGQGERVDALGAALCRAAAATTRALAPWLRDEAERFAPPDPAGVLASPPPAASLAFRAAVEPALEERLAPALEPALRDAEVPRALASLRDAAARLPLRREVTLDPDALLTELVPETFFSVLEQEERLLRTPPAEAP